MSSCIKDKLSYYELVKKCSKCGIISLKSNFPKKSRYKDGLNSICKGCMNYLKNIYKFFLKTMDWNKNNPEKVKQNQKKHNDQNKRK